MDEGLRALERAAGTGDKEAIVRLAHAVTRAGGISYARDRLVQDPQDPLWKQIYFGLGGAWAKCVEDDALGPSLFVSLRYERRRENVIVGLRYVHDREYNPSRWLVSYVRSRNGVIAMPLKLEAAIAEAMYSLRQTPFFEPEVQAYRISFKTCIENVPSSYGIISYRQGITNASLAELTLDGDIRHKIMDIPYDPFILLAPEQEEDSYQFSPNSRIHERGIESLIGSEKSALMLQYFASRRNGLKRRVALKPFHQYRRLVQPEGVLTLCIGNRGKLIIGCGGDGSSDFFARTCRRAP